MEFEPIDSEVQILTTTIACSLKESGVAESILLKLLKKSAILLLFSGDYNFRFGLLYGV